MKNILFWYQLDLLGVNHVVAIFDLQYLSLLKSYDLMMNHSWKSLTPEGIKPRKSHKIAGYLWKGDVIETVSTRVLFICMSR